jgi:hypothetical protein
VRRTEQGKNGGNGTLTLTKSSSVRITDKPENVGSASGSGTRLMSSNRFLPNSNTRICAQINLIKKDPLNYLIRAFAPAR